eukprot:TRINITY_DN14015_c0_g1_i1.p1 TRINITY_DN14015_c0_g1~~TRINITY_DN14015_c0_g1_i1.p1  ORF type:complete len:641 (-),score=100.96 TRINITY_DN14015_c0_g1_i1:267-2189(-)
MKRTKENLLAQHQAFLKDKGQAPPEFKFSFSKLPKGAALQAAGLWVLAAIACFALPLLLPDLGKELYKNKALAHVPQFELSNHVFKGQFKPTSHIGDTRPTQDATYKGISILTANGVRNLKNEDKAQQYVSQLETSEFNKNTQEIYQGLTQMKGLGLLDGAQSKPFVSKYYNLLLSLLERHSGFRLNAQRSASVGATYYALQALTVLGKLEDFKKSEAFQPAIGFVLSMKDQDNGGYRDAAGENATVEATYHAVQVLDERNDKDVKVYEGLDVFLFQCQSRDGGFSDLPIQDVSQLYSKHSSLATTAQAIYILEFLKAHNVISFSFTDASSSSYTAGLNYLRSCLSWNYGVLPHYPASETSLTATYYFLRLVDKFPHVAYGTPRVLQTLSVSFGVLFLLYAIFHFYQPQMNGKTVQEVRSEMRTIGILLALSAISLHLWAPGTVLLYLCFAAYLAIRLYDVLAADNSDGLMPMVAAGTCLTFVGAVFAMSFLSPLVFSNVIVFYVLAIWGAVATLVVTLTAAYVTGIKKMSFYLNAAFVAWILNTVVGYAYLYGRGEMAVVYRHLVIHGHIPAILVFAPVITFALAHAFAAAGASAYLNLSAAPPKRKKPAKPAPAKPLQTIEAAPSADADADAPAPAED